MVRGDSTQGRYTGALDGPLGWCIGVVCRCVGTVHWDVTHACWEVYTDGTWRWYTDSPWGPWDSSQGWYTLRFYNKEAKWTLERAPLLPHLRLAPLLVFG